MPVPFNEVARLEALHRYDLAIDPCEREFSDLVSVAASVCRTPVALIGFLNRDRLTIKSAVGVTACHVPRRSSFGRYVICTSGQPLIVPDARLDPRFADNLLVTHDPHVRFYAAAPLVEPGGHTVGMLAVADLGPRDLSDRQRQTLQTLARQVIALLELRQTKRRLEREISERASYERRVATYQRQLQATNNLLGAASVTDSLTGLANRRAFEQRLVAEIDRANRLLYSLSLLMIDIDHFKHINDTFGHPAGDDVIRLVADVLQSATRTTDFVARLGGDEFTVILPGTDVQGAILFAERCRSAVESVRCPHGRARISVGAAQLMPGALDRSALVQSADQALIGAKKTGRNRVAASSADSGLKSGARTHRADAGVAYR